MKKLVQKLLTIRVKPYYIYQCDLSRGISHFRTTVSKGIEIIENLRGHTSGMAVPTFVVDAPGGGGKTPVMPDYLITSNDKRVILRNYEGVITTYDEPDELPRGLRQVPHLLRRDAAQRHLRRGQAAVGRREDPRAQGPGARRRATWPTSPRGESARGGTGAAGLRGTRGHDRGRNKDGVLRIDARPGPLRPGPGRRRWNRPCSIAPTISWVS